MKDLKEIQELTKSTKELLDDNILLEKILDGAKTELVSEGIVGVQETIEQKIKNNIEKIFG